MKALFLVLFGFVLVLAGGADEHERHLDTDLAWLIGLCPDFFRLQGQLGLMLLVALLHSFETDLLVHHACNLLILLADSLQRLGIAQLKRLGLCLQLELAIFDALFENLGFFLF